MQLDAPPHLTIARAWSKARTLPLPASLNALPWAPARSPVQLPLLGCKVSAGFPSPADDHLQDVISLDEELIDHPAATFLVRAKGTSMIDAGISDGDVLVIDRALTPTHGDIVIAALDGQLTVKTLFARAGRIQLQPANPAYPPIEVHEGQELVIWGVVTSIIHRTRRAVSR